MMEITRKSRVRIAFLIVLSLLLLSFSACGIQETDVSPTEDPRVAQLQSQLEEAQAQIEKLTEENEGGAIDDTVYSEFSMYYSTPEYSQVIVNCPDGPRSEPSLDAPIASHGLNNEYAEVIAQSYVVTLGSDGQRQEEDWLLIRFEVVTVPESSMAWVPMSSVAEYTEDNRTSISRPLKLKSDGAFYSSSGAEDTTVDKSSTFSVDSISGDGKLNVSGVGGWNAVVYPDDVAYPVVGDPSWFN